MPNGRFILPNWAIQPKQAERLLWRNLRPA